MKHFRVIILAILLLSPLLGVCLEEGSHESFERMIKREAAVLIDHGLVGLKVVYISGDVGPWMDTGLDLRRGDRVTMVLQGKRWLSFKHNLSFEPEFALWGRVAPGGAAFRGERTQTFTATNDGQLELKIAPTIRWTDEKGAYDGDPTPVNPDSGGGVSVAIMRWSKEADIVAALSIVSDLENVSSWSADEIERQRTAPRRPPPPWYFLHELGASQIWAETKPHGVDGAPSRVIEARIDNDASIIKLDVDVDLSLDTTLTWKWKIDKLPASVSENSLPTHDYLSIAIEFENGQDLTFYWSHDLPVGTSFRCPLPGWDFRETHVVARSGPESLGQWLREEKNILHHYERAIGGEPPTRITRVWLIAVGVFQQVKGQGEFGDIAINDTKRSIHVY